MVATHRIVGEAEKGPEGPNNSVNIWDSIGIDMSTCGLSREELAQNYDRWIGTNQRCLAIRTDGIVCDCLYTAHHSAQAPTSGKFHHNLIFFLNHIEINSMHL